MDKPTKKLVGRGDGDSGQAFLGILREALVGPAYKKAMDCPYEPVLDLDRHPFDPTWDGMTNWTGFSSDDFLAVLYHSVGCGDISNMFLWAVPQKDNPNHCQYFAEIRNGDHTTHLCCGLTDYSGAGSAALDRCRLAFETIMILTAAPFMLVQLPTGSDDAAHAYVNAQRKLQQDEKAEDAGL